jgi:hypothetical protein
MQASRFLAALLIALSASVSVSASAADAPAPVLVAADKDPIRAVLLESREKNRGVAIHANGTTINAVVVALDEHHVIARSQQSSRIVIRIDRIDGVSAFF